MKPINNWNEIKAVTTKPKLPAGGYVIKIQTATDRGVQISQKTGKSYHALELLFDIDEGEYEGYFRDDYNAAAQRTETPRWKGVLSLFVPAEDGTKEDNATAGRFKGAIVAIEDSNAGYHWDWNERTLVGKRVGCVFRSEEWEWNGQTGFTTKASFLVSIPDLALGKYTVPADKLLKNKSGAETRTQNNGYTELGCDDELPF